MFLYFFIIRYVYYFLEESSKDEKEVEPLSKDIKAPLLPSPHLLLDENVPANIKSQIETIEKS
jgi:hypothetical protein